MMSIVPSTQEYVKWGKPWLTCRKISGSNASQPVSPHGI